MNHWLLLSLLLACPLDEEELEASYREDGVEEEEEREGRAVAVDDETGEEDERAEREEEEADADWGV